MSDLSELTTRHYELNNSMPVLFLAIFFVFVFILFQLLGSPFLGFFLGGLTVSVKFIYDRFTGSGALSHYIFFIRTSNFLSGNNPTNKRKYIERNFKNSKSSFLIKKLKSKFWFLSYK